VPFTPDFVPLKHRKRKGTDKKVVEELLMDLSDSDAQGDSQIHPEPSADTDMIEVVLECGLQDSKAPQRRTAPISKALRSSASPMSFN